MSACAKALGNVLHVDVGAKKMPRNVQQHAGVKRMFAPTNKHEEEHQFVVIINTYLF